MAILREFGVFYFDRKPFRADHERIELPSFCGKVGLASGEGPRPQNDPKRPFHEAAKKTVSKCAAGRGSYGFGAEGNVVSRVTRGDASETYISGVPTAHFHLSLLLPPLIDPNYTPEILRVH